MEPTAIILLVVSAAISFGIGRLISRWRARRKQARALALAAQARALREASPEPVALNKSKRKRQLAEQKTPRQS